MPKTEGRKAKVQGERMVRLLRVLIRFDATGTGECLYPSLTSILKAVRERESLYPKSIAWSRRTVLRYLARLRDSDIEKPNGGKRWAGGQWTRRRILHCSKILPLPVRESGTFEESNLAPKKSKTFASHSTHRLESAKTAASLSRNAFEVQNQTLPKTWKVNQLTKSPMVIPLLNAITMKYGEKYGVDFALDGLFWATRPIPEDTGGERPIEKPVPYVLKCVRNLLARLYDGTFSKREFNSMLDRASDNYGESHDDSEPWRPVTFDKQLGRWRYQDLKIAARHEK